MYITYMKQNGFPQQKLQKKGRKIQKIGLISAFGVLACREKKLLPKVYFRAIPLYFW